MPPTDPLPTRGMQDVSSGFLPSHQASELPEVFHVGAGHGGGAVFALQINKMGQDFQKQCSGVAWK